MKFCPLCDNMLYISTVATGDDDEKSEGDTEFKYVCKHCGHSEAGQGTEVVAETTRADDSTKYNQYLTEYIEHDPTLPRTNRIKCPASACVNRPKGTDEVVYVKYDAVDMKYLYYCCHCKTFWRNNNTNTNTNTNNNNNSATMTAKIPQNDDQTVEGESSS